MTMMSCQENKQKYYDILTPQYRNRFRALTLVMSALFMAQHRIFIVSLTQEDVFGNKHMDNISSNEGCA